MRYSLLFIVLTFQFISSYAATDSIVFSKNGNYVLEKSIYYDNLNGCPHDYWKLYELNKNNSTYTIAFENDSVYFLYYEEPGVKTGRVFKTKDKTNETCTTLASIFKVFSIAEYNAEYEFSLASVASTDTVSFKSKTLKIHNKVSEDEDSTLYFDIAISALLNGKDLFNDTISTNVPKIEHHYKIYYSIDNNFYFVKGWYGYLATDPNTLATLNSSSFLNRIGRRKEEK